MAKKSIVTSAQNVVQDQAGKIVDMAKAGYEGAKSLVGDAVTGTASPIPGGGSTILSG